MKKLLSFLAFLFFAAAAHAQFADQRQYVGNTGGSANAQTAAIPNYNLNVGVALRFTPSFTNTGALTLNVNGSGVVPVKKATPTGVAALNGGEVVINQLAEVVFDGAQYELLTLNVNWLGVSTGSANAQVVNSSAFFNANSGQSIFFLPGFANTGATTLNTIPVYKDTLSGPIALSGGELSATTIAQVIYDTTLAGFHLLTYPIAPGFGALTTIASASTVDLGTAPSHNVGISGIVTTVSFGSSATISAPIYSILYTGAGPWQITQNTLIQNPGGGNLSLNTNDHLTVLYLGSSLWRILAVDRATGNRTVLNQILTITTTATYTPAANFAFAEVVCVGGGAAGGGSGGATNVGGGGGSGEIASGLFTPAQIGASQAVTIGPGGTGVSNASGNAGTTTSFGALLTCRGGVGGFAANGSPGGGGTGGTGGTVRTPGASGFNGITVSASNLSFGGQGGAGYNGVGNGPGALTNGAGAAVPGGAGTGFGSGGGGSGTVTTGASEAGGNGAPGVVIIKEWVYAP